MSGFPYRSFAFNGQAILEKSLTNGQNTLHMPRRVRISVAVLGRLIIYSALSVFEASCS